MRVQHPCHNKASGYNWNSPDGENITTAEELQDLADMHFAVCPTNLTVIKTRKERNKETHAEGRKRRTRMLNQTKPTPHKVLQPSPRPQLCPAPGSSTPQRSCI